MKDKDKEYIESAHVKQKIGGAAVSKLLERKIDKKHRLLRKHHCDQFYNCYFEHLFFFTHIYGYSPYLCPTYFKQLN